MQRLKPSKSQEAEAASTHSSEITADTAAKPHSSPGTCFFSKRASRISTREKAAAYL